MPDAAALRCVSRYPWLMMMILMLTAPGPGKAPGGPSFAIWTVPTNLSKKKKIENIPLFYPRGCAAPLRGIAPIATLERFVVYCSSELIISARPPGAGPRARPRGHGELLKLLRSVPPVPSVPVAMAQRLKHNVISCRASADVNGTVAGIQVIVS